MEEEKENSINGSSEDFDEEEEEEEVEETKKQGRSRKRSEMLKEATAGKDPAAAAGRKEQEQEQEKKLKNNKNKKRRKLLLEEQASVAGKRGICYLSRIPPHLKPLKLRHLLSQHGEVLRIYLAPEDAAARMRRRRRGGGDGGGGGKNFTEGWVEFAHKSVAKRVAAMLNGEPMEARRRSAYHYDLWTIKYLRKFKWDNLTEEIAYKNAVREQRLAAEISAAKKERDFYLSRVDQSRAINSMAERKRKRKEQEAQEAQEEAQEQQAQGQEAPEQEAREEASGVRPDGDFSGKKKKSRLLRFFPQKKSVGDGVVAADAATGTTAAPRLVGLDVLSKVFGGEKGD